MMHDLPLIQTIAAAFFAAWVLGLLTQKLRLSPIVGYLLAGIVIGPHTPGYVGDPEIAHQLAEVGVILLMFGVGLHFHLKDLAAVKWIAVPGAVGQSVVATVAGLIVFSMFGWGMKPSLVMGMAMAVASTVVLIRVLMDNKVLSSPAGHAAVGWLIVEDLFTVVFLVLLPMMGEPAAIEGHAAAPAGSMWQTLGWALLKIAVLVAIVLLGGSKVIPGILVRVARLRSRELFTLTVLVMSIAVAAGSYTFFGATMALGAFLAGMVVAQSPVSQQAASDAMPMRDAFAVLFFVAVGMLFDPHVIINQPLLLIGAIAIVLIAKPLAALVIVAVLGHSVRTGLVVALGLAQIGEFSFILAKVAKDHKLLTSEGESVIVAAAIISITLNPLLFKLAGPMEAWLKARPKLWKMFNGRAERALAAQNADAIVRAAENKEHERSAVLIGYGHVGKTVEGLLRQSGIRTIVIDLNMDTVAAINAAGGTAIFGDAASPTVLEQAGVEHARYLIVTMAASSNPAPVVLQARELNPDMHILVRGRYLGERDSIMQAGATNAIFEEAEAAKALSEAVVEDLAKAMPHLPPSVPPRPAPEFDDIPRRQA